MPRIAQSARQAISRRNRRPNQPVRSSIEAPPKISFDLSGVVTRKPSMDSKKYTGMDVHKESISIAVMNGAGKIVMECVIETKASMILQFIDGLRGDVQVTFEEGTSAAWLYDLLKPHVTNLLGKWNHFRVARDSMTNRQRTAA